MVMFLSFVFQIQNTLILSGSLSFDPRERHTVWSLVIGLGISCVFGYGLSQAAVQRFSAVDKLSKARA